MDNFLAAYLSGPGKDQLDLMAVPALASLVSLLPEQDSSVDNVDITAEGDTLVLSGQITLFGADAPVPIQLRISGSDEDYQLVLSGTLPDDWKLGTAFGALPGSLVKQEDGSSAVGPSVLNDLTLSEGAFTVANATIPDDEIVKGISLSGTLALSETSLGDYGSLISFPESLTIEGTVDLTDTNTPLIDLKASVAGSLGFGAVDATDLYVNFSTQAGEDGKAALSTMGIGANVTLGSGDQAVSFTLSGLLESPEEPMVFSFEGQDKSVMLGNGVTLLAQLAGFELTMDLPSPLDALANLYLESASFSLDVNSKAVVGLDVKVGLDGTWDVIPGADGVAIQNLALAVSAEHPTDAEQRSVSYTLNGESLIGKENPATLEVTATAEDNWSVSGTLKEDETISLSDLLAQYVSIDGLPQVDITSLSMEASQGGDFSLDVGIDAQWDVPFNANISFGLTEVVASVSRSEGSYSASFAGNLTLANQTFVMALEKVTNGWSFTGSTAEGTQVPIGELVGYIGQRFGIDVPGALVDVTMQDVAVAFDSSSKDFSFDGSLSAPFEVGIGPANAELTLSAALSSTVDANTNKRSFEGTLSGVWDIGDADFTVQVGVGTANQFVRGIWGSDEKTFGLEDLLGLFQIDFDIPDAVDLNLTKATFEYDVSLRQFTLSAESKVYGDAFFVARSQASGWAFVFGMEMPEQFQLSEIPVIGDALSPADFMAFNRAAFLLSSAVIQDYELPSLPPLALSFNVGSGTVAVAEQKEISPTGEGAKLQLQRGVTVVAILDMNEDGGNPLLKNLASLVNIEALVVQMSVGTSGLQIHASLGEDIKLPSGPNTLALKNPALTINFSTAIVFKVSGSMAFSIFGTDILATAMMTIGTNAATVGVSVESDNSYFPAPPGVKGLHLKQFGIIMGVYFAPAGLMMGIQGKYAIGEGKIQDDEFAMVLQMVGNIPNPLYLSFYADELSLGRIYTLYTDEPLPAPASMLNEVRANDVSFYWAQNVVTLPDGTLAQPGYGFSAQIKLFDFGLYGMFKVNAQEGIQGHAEMSPINLKGILTLDGDGKGIYETQVEKNGTWIRAQNTEIDRDQDLPTREVAIVKPGGPVIEITTSSSPFIHANWNVSLFDAINQSVDVHFGIDGATFALDYNLSDIESYSLSCTVKDWTSFNGSASYSFGIDTKIGPFKVLGINVGTLHLDVNLSTDMSITLSPSIFSLSLTGAFDFMGLGFDMPTLYVSVAPSTLAAIPGMVIDHIKEEAKQLFAQLFDSMDQWGKLVAQGLIEGYDAVENVLKNAYNATAKEAAKIMRDIGNAAEDVAKALKQVGYLAEDVAGGLEDAYQLGQQGVANAMKAADYAADEVAKGLSTAFNATADEAAKIMKGAGYAASEVAGGLKSAFNASSDAVTAAMKGAGYVAEDIASGLQSAYKLGASATATALKGAGYAVDAVTSGIWKAYKLSDTSAINALKGAGYAAGDVFKSVYPGGSDWGPAMMKHAGYGANELANGLKEAYGYGATEVANQLKGLGYGINDVGNALGSAYGFTADGISSALKGAGYAADQVGGFLKGTGRFADDAVNSALKGAGYAASEVTNFMKDAFGGKWIPHVDLPYVDIPTPHIDHIDLPYVDIPRPHFDGW
ncbi:MAG: hypothetical protein AAFQ98_07915 [Bacteroidota bacterium]